MFVLTEFVLTKFDMAEFHCKCNSSFSNKNKRNILLINSSLYVLYRFLRCDRHKKFSMTKSFELSNRSSIRGEDDTVDKVSENYTKKTNTPSCDVTKVFPNVRVRSFGSII